MSSDASSDFFSLEPDRMLELQHAEKLLQGIIIPPRPSVLVEVLNEQSSSEPDLDRIAEVIKSDVALAAGTLKVVNSPFYGLRRRIGSIHHAVRLIGVGNVSNIVTGLMLHSAFAAGVQGSRFMDRFWATSRQLAAIAAVVAREAGSVGPDEAYTLGLLVDSGVPLLLRRFDDYPRVYDAAVAQDEQPTPGYEQDEIGTDHTMVGYLVGRSWKLPDELCQCILRHHDTAPYFTPSDDDDERRPPVSLELLSVIMLAQEIQRELQGLPAAAEWHVQGHGVLDYLRLNEDDLAAVKDSVARTLDSQPA